MALTKVTSGLISADASSVDLNIDAGTLYIDATNNRVGVANTSPSATLDVSGTAVVNQLNINSASYDNRQLGMDSNGFFIYNSADASYDMVISDTGNLLWANTSGVSSSQKGITFNNTANPYIQVSGGADTSFRYRMEFINGNGTVGTITTNGSATAYNTSSDYRLKENVVDMDGAIDRVKALQPKRFNFIADADTTFDGFLAHEVSEVIPEAIHGEKDAVDEEGNAAYQGIDQSKLVPLLTGALKEAIAKIETLEARITALENA